MVKSGTFPASASGRGGRYRRRWWFFPRGAVAAVFLVQALLPLFGSARAQTAAGGASICLDIVAAENFYQDIAVQIAGPCVRVKSVLSDPNVDPHEYEPTVKDAEAVSAANLVIVNGGGYDEWMGKLLSASPKSDRLVITGWDVSPVKLHGNEHVWYSVEDMKSVAAAIAEDLKRLLPSRAGEFDHNLKVFTGSLDRIGGKMGEISKRFSGTPVALTEPIFMYQAVPMGLKVLTPFELQKAVAEGIDPPADTMLIAEEQIREKKVRVLIYNRQTADRFTVRLEDLAKTSGVPVVAVTETMPPGKHYQSWMLDQIEALESGLSGRGGGER